MNVLSSFAVLSVIVFTTTYTAILSDAFYGTKFKDYMGAQLAQMKGEAQKAYDSSALKPAVSPYIPAIPPLPAADSPSPIATPSADNGYETVPGSPSPSPSPSASPSPTSSPAAN